jgi:uncharacterized sulfatase
MFTQYLREAGYYCANNKEDYNLDKPGLVWDDSSPGAHYRNRKPGQPFFADFYLAPPAEAWPRLTKDDVARLRVPAYHPDTPEVRQDWARHYEHIAAIDAMVGDKLKELEDTGLAKDTIVFFYSDHGADMPRCRRLVYDDGLHVPLIVYVPEKWRQLVPPDYQPGAATARLVSGVDFAPTVLSLVGIKPPSTMQGRSFLGKYSTEPRQYLFGFRGRMDERIDLIRSVRDQRYVYIRNYLPHKIYGQHVRTMFQQASTQVWKKLFDDKKLNAVQSAFWRPKPVEELYDLENDPDEVHNLAESPAHRHTLERLRQAQRDHLLEIHDVGLLPEDEIHRRSRGTTPYEMARDPRKYPLARILGAAELASSLRPAATPELVKLLGDADSAVRYWAALGFLMRGPTAVNTATNNLAKALDDPAPAVRIAAAEALGRYGQEEELRKSLDVLLNLSNPVSNGPYVAIEALNAIDNLGPRAAGLKNAIAILPLNDPNTPRRPNDYVHRLVSHLIGTATK